MGGQISYLYWSKNVLLSLFLKKLWLQEVEAVKVIIPGEEELGQTGHQTLCFLSHAAQADFIAPDAMAKLRQVPT